MEFDLEVGGAIQPLPGGQAVMRSVLPRMGVAPEPVAHRRLPVRLGGFGRRYAVRLVLPEGSRVESLPPARLEAGGFGELHCAWSVKGDTLQLNWGFVTRRAPVEAARYEDLRRFLAAAYRPPDAVVLRLGR